MSSKKDSKKKSFKPNVKVKRRQPRNSRRGPDLTKEKEKKKERKPRVRKFEASSIPSTVTFAAPSAFKGSTANERAALANVAGGAGGGTGGGAGGSGSGGGGASGWSGGIFDDNGQVVKVERPARPEVHLGDFYYEDDTLDNNEPNQYMPVVCPFPDVKGFEVREDQDQEQDQGLLEDATKIESLSLDSKTEAKVEPKPKTEGASKDSAVRVKAERDDPGIMQDGYSEGSSKSSAIRVKEEKGGPAKPAGEFAHCSKSVQAMHSWFEEAKLEKPRVAVAPAKQTQPKKMDEGESDGTRANEGKEEVEDEDDVAMAETETKTAGEKKGATQQPPKKSFTPLVLMQFPTHLPLTPASAQAQMAKAQGMQPEDLKTELPAVTKASVSSQKPFTSSADYTVRNVPPGQIGKLVFYKSGKVKMRIGGSLFDVSPGTGCLFDQEVVAVDTEEKGFHRLGSVNRRLVCSLDVQAILAAEKTSKGKKQ